MTEIRPQQPTPEELAERRSERAREWALHALREYGSVNGRWLNPVDAAALARWVRTRVGGWAWLRAVLEARGVLPVLDLRAALGYAPPGAGEVLVLCNVGSPGPPAGVAALEAPVISP